MDNRPDGQGLRRIDVLRFEDTDLEPLEMDGLVVPLIRLPGETPPDAQVAVAGKEYQYDRSYPDPGYAAVMPAYLREQMAAGKRPLLIERPERFYLYLG